jgi:hypothetical protein
MIKLMGHETNIKVENSMSRQFLYIVIQRILIIGGSKNDEIYLPKPNQKSFKQIMDLDEIDEEYEEVDGDYEKDSLDANYDDYDRNDNAVCEKDEKTFFGGKSSL